MEVADSGFGRRRINWVILWPGVALLQVSEVLFWSWQILPLQVAIDRIPTLMGMDLRALACLIGACQNMFVKERYTGRQHLVVATSPCSLLFSPAKGVVFVRLVI
jgi:hypothetical protein